MSFCKTDRWPPCVAYRSPPHRSAVPQSRQAALSRATAIAFAAWRGFAAVVAVSGGIGLPRSRADDGCKLPASASRDRVSLSYQVIIRRLVRDREGFPVTPPMPGRRSAPSTTPAKTLSGTPAAVPPSADVLAADPPALERLLTVEEAAHILNLSVRHVRRMIASGDLDVVRFGSAVRIHPRTLAALCGRCR